MSDKLSANINLTEKELFLIVSLIDYRKEILFDEYRAGIANVKNFYSYLMQSGLFLNTDFLSDTIRYISDISDLRNKIYDEISSLGECNEK